MIAHRPGSQAWHDYVATVGNESMRAALRIIELSPRLLEDAQRFLDVPKIGAHVEVKPSADALLPRSAEFMSRSWTLDVDLRGRGWSTTERSLYEIAAALLDCERLIRFDDVIWGLGSIRPSVMRILAVT